MSLSLEKDKIQVLLLEGPHSSAKAHFLAKGYHNITVEPGALDEAELIERIAQVHIIGVRSRTQITPAVLAKAQKLFAIGCFCIGTNQVALEAAANQGIAVFNAPFANTRSVAELVLAEMILLLRQILPKDKLAHQGVWQKSASGAFEARGKTLGIIGYGHIGSQLSVLAEGLGMQVCFYDIERKLVLGNAEQVDTLEALLAKADIVSCHVPDTPDTIGMIAAREFDLMRSGAVLINASRGSVVDVDALANAIKSEKLAGAAVDVFPTEPSSAQEAFQSPLQGLDNVLLTPHIAGSTQEAQANIGFEVAEKLVKYSDNGSTRSAVNFPEVALPTHPNKQRLLHIHQNQPGVLNAINQVFSDHKVNVVGQYLQTNNAVGYVVMDVESDAGTTLLQALKSIPGTIRARLLF